ncbi:ABC transporter permease [Oceanirhabdus seepicola]|uniref:ABC transporter permease n=1 Tax=Oceanirhabdus seepicola TaxID=2828781 RepID=A0A9J6P1E7_9CLOT|nr:ABC transporter permease [Oceanirhabdus seepicola]MCM1990487.1 ABC transporter permease [Oceanirhabdus seepicola]
MRILSIAIKDLKEIVRDKSVLFMMILFPLLLILILGTALGGASVSGGKDTVINTKALYFIEKEGIAEEAFNSFSENIDKKLIEFDEVKTKEKGIELLYKGKYPALIIINSEENKIQVVKSPKFDFEGDFVEGLISSFADSASVAMIMYKYDINSINDIKEGKNYSDYVTVKGIKDDSKAPRAIDYYGITMLTMIIMYMTTMASEYVLLEKKLGTEKRINITNTTGTEMFFGKLLAQVVTGVIQIALIMGVSSLVYKVNYGDDLISVILIIASQGILMIAIGLATGIFTNPDSPSESILNILIPILVFLGGGYFPINNLGSKFLTNLGNISPVKWINQSLLDVIYEGSYTMVNKLLLINGAVTLILLIIVALKFRRRECK